MQPSSSVAESAAACPVSAAAQGLADPMLYAAGFQFRSVWAGLRAADHLEWT